MKMKLFSASIAILIVAFFVFNFSVAAAQEETVAEVTPEEMGVSDQNVLPDSPFYGFKEAWRGVKKAFTFSAEGKAKKELQYASEKLIEAQKVAKKQGDETAKSDVLKKAVENFQTNVESFKSRAAGLNPEAKNRLETQALKLHVKQTTILDNLEADVPEAALAAVKQARDRAHESMASIIGDNAAPMIEALRQLSADGAGGEFKDFKALEVLKAVGEKVEAVSRDAIRQAQANAQESLRQKFEAIPENERAERLQEYLKHMPGDEANRMGVLNDLQTSGEIPSEIRTRIEALKSESAQRFEEKFKNVSDPAVRERFFETLQSSDPAKVEILNDLRSRSTDSFVRQRLNQTIDNTAQNIQDRLQTISDPAELERFKQTLQSEIPPQSRAEIQNRAPELSGQLQEKQRFFEEQARQGIQPGQQPFQPRDADDRSQRSLEPGEFTEPGEQPKEFGGNRGVGGQPQKQPGLQRQQPNQGRTEFPGQGQGQGQGSENFQNRGESSQKFNSAPGQPGTGEFSKPAQPSQGSQQFNSAPNQPSPSGSGGSDGPGAPSGPGPGPSGNFSSQPTGSQGAPAPSGGGGSAGPSADSAGSPQAGSAVKGIINFFR